MVFAREAAAEPEERERAGDLICAIPALRGRGTLGKGEKGEHEDDVSQQEGPVLNWRVRWVR